MAEDTRAWARSVALKFNREHWKGLRWLSNRPGPWMFPSGGNAHAFLVIKNCAAEPTDTKPFWSLTPRGQALMEYVRELGDKLTKKQQRELARCLIDPPPFRRISKPLKAIRPHLVVPSFEDLVTTEVTNIGHAVAHTVMTRKQLLAVLIGEKPS